MKTDLFPAYFGHRKLIAVLVAVLALLAVAFSNAYRRVGTYNRAYIHARGKFRPHRLASYRG